MNQPPTIPEGDEENEGVEQRGEGTRFPQTGAQQHVAHPPIHDTVASATDLQPREDEGVGYGQTPTMQPEMIAVSGEVPTDASQQAEYEQPSSVEHPIIEDGAKEGAPPTTEEEQELLHPPAGEEVPQEPGVEQDEEKPLPIIEEPVVGTPREAPADEHVKQEGLVIDSVSRI